MYRLYISEKAKPLMPPTAVSRTANGDPIALVNPPGSHPITAPIMVGDQRADGLDYKAIGLTHPSPLSRVGNLYSGSVWFRYSAFGLHPSRFRPGPLARLRTPIGPIAAPKHFRRGISRSTPRLSGATFGGQGHADCHGPLLPQGSQWVERSTGARLRPGGPKRLAHPCVHRCAVLAVELRSAPD
jgi:hypothetical protein